MRVVNRSSSAFPDRSAAELRASFEELNAMVASTRSWNSAECWLDSNCGVVRYERQAVGLDGEQFAWTRLFVFDARNGQATGMCEFEPENENEAFAYAEERMRATTSRLAVTNRSCETVHAINRAMQSHDTDGAMRCFSDRLVYDDRRRLSGDPIHGRAAFRTAFDRILEQYSRFEGRILAVRGDCLNLFWSRWSDDAGNAIAYLHVFEIGDDGRQAYEGRFDEDDFEGAYRELDRRYYAGEGAAFAEGGGLGTEWVIAVNACDFDRAFGEIMTPDALFENRSRSAFPDPSVSEPGASFRDLQASVAALRTWYSVICWLSPDWGVSRLEREAVGQDGETYTWTWLGVSGLRDGRVVSSCLFDLEDENAAFAYAEERARLSE
jgi:limonene-1,2-epoxide hydrolase